MIIYRPHRGGLRESMAEAREFESVEAMKKYIVEQNTIPEWGRPFSVKDIVVRKSEGADERVGWKNVRRVCIKRYYVQDYIELFGAPQCIGHCATDYGSLEQSQRMCKEFLEGKHEQET